MTDAGKYAKLEAPRPTPADEICACPGLTPVMLMTLLSSNPIHCAVCNLEVPPGRLDLSTSLVDAVASWNSVADAIYRLWLDSGAYETWARDQLVDMNSSINREGQRVRSELNATRRCYYWHFREESGPLEGLRMNCPGCGHEMQIAAFTTFKRRICEPCSIIA